MPARSAAKSHAERSSAIVLMIWTAMCIYLLLASLPAMLAGGLRIEPALLVLQAWTLQFWMPWLLLAPAVVYFLRRHPLPPVFSYGTGMRFLAMLVALVLLHAVALFFMLFLRAALQGGGDIDPDAYESAVGRMLFQEGYCLFDALILTVLAASARFTQLQHQLRDRERDAWQLGRNLTDSKLQTLKMQLNPHFLFNTLNGLAVLIDKNENEKARAMLGELSSFLRQTLRNPQEKWVTLATELDFARQYLKMEQYRFGKRLTWFEECEPLALTARIPPMLLQPLIENAIVHGLADKQGECRLGFECRLYDRYLIILIFDNGDTFDETSDPLGNGGIGLSNVQSRLREVYGDNGSLRIEKKPDGTLVTLTLPSYKDSQF